jgi:hypothetical protein
MTTTAEYRAWAEESLEWASKATTESEREAYTKFAEVWLESALRSEALSKQPTQTEYVWPLPRFEDWRSKAPRKGPAHQR